MLPSQARAVHEAFAVLCGFAGSARTLFRSRLSHQHVEKFGDGGVDYGGLLEC